MSFFQAYCQTTAPVNAIALPAMPASKIANGLSRWDIMLISLNPSSPWSSSAPSNR